ncbi:MAG: acyltransferase domain-containing protein, partial [Oligoflexia bacterium]|nr:acyltransferase domain-containing protein [Oligoflexia bacterium]
MSDPSRHPIAIVGVSAIFPGSTDANAFWSNILASTDLLTDVPPSHWLIEDYYDPDRSAPDKTYAKRGGFLPTVDFDALTWGVPPSLLPATDTAQLMALIVAQKVLEDAFGSQFKDMDKDRMSCILGVTSAQELLNNMVSRLQRPVWVKSMRDAGLGEDEVQDIADRIADHYAPWQEATFPGLLGNVVAGRIANRLDLGGTNCVTDAACASTFSALHMAINELSMGDSDVVIAGGVDTMNDIFMYMCFSKTPALSPTGDCRPFSDQADGTMLGEGMAMVALKRLQDAERDGDNIYAVIKAIGSSSDGRSKSVYAPVSQGQAKSIRRAYDRAGFGADTVELIEAHGTGTKAGDAAEFGGLQMVFEETGRTDRQWCALGSVKSQIGHTKAAAGAAGLFKGVMALHHKILPPTAKVDRPNPDLHIDTSPFYLGTQARPWIRSSDHPRRAGISAFGFGGSNFHVALEEYTGTQRPGRLRTWSHELVLLAADSASELSAQAASLSETATDLRFEAWHRSQTWRGGAHRLAVVASSLDELKDLLKTAAELVAKGKPRSTPNGIHYGHGTTDGQVAFLFPGQGSQRIDMGATVAMNLDAARAAWDLSADLPMGTQGDHTVALHTVVFPRSAFTDAQRESQAQTLTLTQWAQPALGAASLALLNVATSLGLKADHVAGHSFGEITALQAAGLLGATDMLRVARKRGELMAEAARIDGTMTAVAAPIERVRDLLDQWKLADPLDGGVVIANHNHSQQVVLSGPTLAIAAVEQRLEAAGITARRLKVATAFHSPVVSDSTVPFAAFLDDIDIQTPTMQPPVTVWSNATAAPYDTAPDSVRAALSAQLAQPVRFVEMIEAMHDAGARTFVEVGPGHVLTKLTDRILRGRDHLAVSLDRKGRDGLHQLLDATAQLLAAGLDLRPTALWDGYKAPADPALWVKPKLAVPINGANVGKPYPPAQGAAGRPAPNPKRAPVLVEKVVEKVVEVPVEVRVEVPVAASGAGQADGSWLMAYQEVQRQTAEAHAAYQRAMSDSHTAFLKAAETSIMGLATLGGQMPQA